MKKLVMAAALTLALSACGGGGDSDSTSQALLATTTLTAEYLEQSATATHKAYDADAATLDTILESNGQVDPAAVQQAHLDLLITDATVLPELGEEYVESLSGAKRKKQLVAVFEKVKTDEVAYYTERLTALYQDRWQQTVPPEAVQALQKAMNEEYASVENDL